MKRGEPIIGSDSRVGLISSPQLNTGGIEVRIISGESLFEASDVGGGRKGSISMIPESGESHSKWVFT